MVRPSLTGRRAVLVTSQAPPTESGTKTNERSRVRAVTHPGRVRDLLRTMLVGRAAHLSVPGREQPFEVVLDRLPPPARAMEAPVAASAADPEFAAFAWQRGLQVAAWFPQPTGIHGFKTTVVGFGGERLLLESPAAIVRYSRRASPRYAIRDDEPPTVLVPLVDRTWLECREVLDISIGGLSIVLPADVELALGAVTTLALRLLRADHPLTLKAACRHARPHGPGRVRYGLQFLEAPRLASLGIARYVQKMGLRSLEDDVPVLPPPLALSPAARLA